jgi:hypothetical protein
MSEAHSMSIIMMTPHVVELRPPMTVGDIRPGDEARLPGFHRVIERVDCSCGETFEKADYPRGNALLAAAQGHASE